MAGSRRGKERVVEGVFLTLPFIEPLQMVVECLASGPESERPGSKFREETRSRRSRYLRCRDTDLYEY